MVSPLIALLPFVLSLEKALLPLSPLVCDEHANRRSNRYISLISCVLLRTDENLCPEVLERQVAAALSA